MIWNTFLSVDEIVGLGACAVKTKDYIRTSWQRHNHNLTTLNIATHNYEYLHSPYSQQTKEPVTRVVTSYTFQRATALLHPNE